MLECPLVKDHIPVPQKKWLPQAIRDGTQINSCNARNTPLFVCASCLNLHSNYAPFNQEKQAGCILNVLQSCTLTRAIEHLNRVQRVLP